MKLIVTLRRAPSGPEILAINKHIDRARAMGMRAGMNFTNAMVTITIDGDSPPEREVSAAEFEQRIRDGQWVARRQRELGIAPGRLSGEAIGPLVNSLARRFGLATRGAPPNTEASHDMGGIGGTVHIDINPDIVAAWAKMGESMGRIFTKLGEDLFKGY